MIERLARIHRLLPAVLGLLAFGVAYYALSRVGLALKAQPEEVSVFWPASGVALGVVALSPRRWWPALAGTIFIANLIAQLIARGAHPASFGLAATNAIEPILAAGVLILIAGPTRRFVYSSVRGVAGLAAAATLANGVTALLGGSIISLSFGAPFASAVTTWWVADGLGMLAVSPVIFAFVARGRAPFPFEELALLGAVGALTWALINPDAWHLPDAAVRPSLVLPLIVWTAIRGGPRTVALSILIVTVVFTAATLDGNGLFAADTAGQLSAIEGLQVFLAITTLLALIVEGVLSEQRAAEDGLAHSNRLLDSVLRSATEFAVITTDRDGLITIFNAGATKMLGYSAEEMVGIATPAIIHEPEEVVQRAYELGIEPGFDVFVQAARAGRAETREWTYIRKDGTRLPVSLTITPVRDDAGELMGFMGLARDVSEARQVETERAALVKVSRSTAAAEPLETTLDLALAELGQIAGVSATAALRFDDGEGEVVASWTRDDGDPPTTGEEPAAAVPIVESGHVWGELRVIARRGDGATTIPRESLRRFADLIGLAVTGAEQRATLKRRRDELSAIIDGLPALVWVRDNDGRTVLANRALNEFMSVASANAAASEPVSGIFDEALDREALAEGRFIQTEQTVTDALGIERALLVARSPLLSDDGQSLGLCCVATDITERREAERVKDEFVAVVSHELRTPLSSIRGSLAMLADERDQLPAEAEERMIEIASTNAERLVALINDILDLQRIESGMATLELAAHDAGDLVRQAAEAMESFAADKDITINTTGADAPVTLDGARTLQVLNNFISNAVKFSAEGSTVTVGWERRDEDLAFFVRDQGRGIPSDKLEVVFERFQQVDSSDSRTVGGTGLGLAICRQIATQHNGRVWAESVEGAGSTFWFAVPAKQTAAAGATPPASDGATVLVCDDDPRARATTVALLAELGIATLEADSGKAAVDLARETRPSAVVLDMVMPGMDGVETMEALKRDPDTAGIPVVVVSSFPAPENGARSAALDWLPKPVPAARLLEALSAAFVPADRGRVLVVEDDDGLADILLEHLRQDAVPTVRASTSDEAIELAARLKPEVMVLDVTLAEGDGFKVVQALRDRGVEPASVLVYSAQDLDRSERERLRLGDNTEFLQKASVSPAEFHDRLDALLRDA